MTQEQKTLALYYREQQRTYREIGEKLGLSPDTVKTFCRRNRKQKERAVQKEGFQCKNCDAPIYPFPGKRESLFCSAACRTAYWRKHNLLSLPPRHCAGCGTLLTGGSIVKKYCCHACYIRHRFGNDSASSISLEKEKMVCLAKKKVASNVPMLTKEQFERELNYRSVLSIAKQMREEGLVTPREFVQIDIFLQEKFSPVWGGLYQSIS